MLTYIKQVVIRLRELVLSFLAFCLMPGSSLSGVLRELVKILSFVIRKTLPLAYPLILFPALFERWKWRTFNVEQLKSYYSNPLYILHLISSEYSYGKLEVLRTVITVIHHFLLTDDGCKRFLDIGCGIGTYTAYICKAFPSKFCSINFIDIGIPQIEITKSRVEQGEGILASATHLPYRSNTLHFVICFDVLEHIEDPIASISEINRVLVDGGFALVNLTVNSMAADHICKIDRRQFETYLKSTFETCYMTRTSNPIYICRKNQHSRSSAPARAIISLNE
ncbi:MAG: class I SAM-dependent methyltransferase [Candidatus Korarchaeota archaeon]|nr:class I SAM-dependent methyltransferase [Thermoproteota archaeon]